ncbi:MAG: AraC family transcriptional regulator [Betaproteobacteria bacterium]|nr:AraC family transcriptional regulator [Betaproteobacteria bacterium]
MTTPASTTVPISFVHNLLQGTTLTGTRREAAVEKAGIAPALLEAETARVTTEQFATLYRHLARELDDELPGMFSRPVRAGAFKFLCLSLLESANLQTALFRFTRFFHLVLEDLAIDLSRQDGLIRMALIPQVPLAARNTFAQEIMLKLIHGVASWLTGHKLPLARVDFAYPRPRHASEYVFLYPGPVHFDQPQTAIYFEAAQLATPIRQDKHSLGTFLSRAPGDWLFVSFAERIVSHRVRETLEKYLHQPTSIEDVATALHTSVRTLSRHLREEGATFQGIKDELRRDVAIQRLTKTNTPIAVIGNEVGFDDPTTFHRAFRKWTGSTPGAYRLRR